MSLPKILIVNKFFYPRGGDCIVAMAQEKILREAGFRTAVFTMDFQKNIQTADTPVYKAGEVDFSGSPMQKIKAAARVMGFGVHKSFQKTLEDFRPDIVHFHNIHSYLSPHIVRQAHLFGAKTVWTLHDYKLICPTYLCLRNGIPCTECIEDPGSVKKYRCHKESKVASVLAYEEAKKWNRALLSSWTKEFVAQSTFMKRMMEKGGIDEHKLHVICNSIDPLKMEIFNVDSQEVRSDYYLYIGRLSPEKGIGTLIEAAKDINKALHIYGDGPSMAELREKAAPYRQIIFHGHADAREISKALLSAKCSVIPSECYENNPLGIIESLCAGTPVTGAETGGIPELLNEHNGITFPPGNADKLRTAIETTLARDWDNNAIASIAQDAFSRETQLRKLVSLYSALLDKDIEI